MKGPRRTVPWKNGSRNSFVWFIWTIRFHVKINSNRIEIMISKSMSWVNGRRMKRPLPFSPHWFFFVKYPAEHNSKIKGGLVGVASGRGLGAKKPPRKTQRTISFVKLLKSTITSPNFSFLGIILLSAYLSHVWAGSWRTIPYNKVSGLLFSIC